MTRVCTLIWPSHSCLSQTLARSLAEYTNTELFNDHPERWWNKFYSNNKVKFFKDRKWLQQEFPILGTVTQPDSPPTVILEVGAGAGNTAFPILKLNKNPKLKIHACDFSKKAVELIQCSPAYADTAKVGSIHATVWDVAQPPDPETMAPSLPEGLGFESVDVVILIFIFSALAPSQWEQAISNVWSVLKPGGVVLFRDYGRGDLAQVRFKKGRYLQENFYIRGDGTRVYFFEEQELRRLWAGQVKEEEQTGTLGSGTANIDLQESAVAPQRKFEVLNLAVDRRMLVNRQRRLKMYRCWLQARFRKPPRSKFEDQSIHGEWTNPSAVQLLARDLPELRTSSVIIDAAMSDEVPTSQA